MGQGADGNVCSLKWPDLLYIAKQWETELGGQGPSLWVKESGLHSTCRKLCILCSQTELHWSSHTVWCRMKRSRSVTLHS